MKISAKKNIEKYREREYNEINDIHDYIEKNDNYEMYLVDKQGIEQHFNDGLFGLLGILGADSLDDVTNIKYIKNEFNFIFNGNEYILGSL